MVVTYWGDPDRIAKINNMIRDIRHDLGIIERILKHMGTKPPESYDPSSRGP